MVVMIALVRPIRRPITSITGALQLVLQLAQDTTSASPTSFTPWKMKGTPSPFAGAERITFPAPASRYFISSSLWVNTPVQSNTRSMPISDHGRRAGSSSFRTR